LGKCVGSCQPDDVACTDKSHYEICSDVGTAGPAQPCNKACYMNQCTGSCVPGTQDCLNAGGTSAPETCNDQGNYVKGTACVLYDYICKANAGLASCASNPPYKVGQSVSQPGFTDIPKNMLFGNPVLISKRAQVSKLGLIAAVAGSGTGGQHGVAPCNVTMVLYTDDGSVPGGPGKPASQVAQSDVRTLTSADLGNAVEIDLTTQPAPLTAGKYYWIMAQYGCDTGSQKGQGAGNPDLKYVLNAPPAPQQFPTSGVLTSTAYLVSHYLVAQDAP
jgi:hypothetical protein